MSAALEFHWPGKDQESSTDAPRPQRPAPSPARPAPADEAPPDGARPEVLLRAAIKRIRHLEAELSATRQELAEATSAVDTQGVHIDALATDVRRLRARAKNTRPKR